MSTGEEQPEQPGLAIRPTKPPPPPHDRRRRFSDVTWPRVIIVLGLAALGIVALAFHSEMVAGMLIGGAIGSNVPLSGKAGGQTR
jgi:hypothetical protein